MKIPGQFEAEINSAWITPNARAQVSEILITFRAYGDCQRPKMGPDPIDCDSDVDVFVVSTPMMILLVSLMSKALRE